MKKIFVMMLVLTLLVVTVFPALAAGGPQTSHGRRTGEGFRNGGNVLFAFTGIIASLDPAARTVTVSVAYGNRLIKPYFDQHLSIQTNDDTRFLLRNPDGKATPITFTDLVVGQKVSVNGQLTDNVWTASRITVGAKLLCLP